VNYEYSSSARQRATSAFFIVSESLFRIRSLRGQEHGGKSMLTVAKVLAIRANSYHSSRVERLFVSALRV
jgi:hypothetical protein